jgi:ABC-type polysaccharide/polyol phosphate export permease
LKDEQQKTIVQVESASEDEALLADWGRELFKSSLTLANDVLKQVVTITSLLLTVALGFLDKTGAGKAWQVLVFLLLLAPLIVSFLGLAPSDAEIDIRDPEKLRNFRNQILRKKRRALHWITCFLVAAFVCAMLGVLTRPAS